MVECCQTKILLTSRILMSEITGFCTVEQKETQTNTIVFNDSGQAKL